MTQKSFDTTSSDIDLLHRMEKLVHAPPVTKIIMSEDFTKGLDSAAHRSVVDVGEHFFVKEGRNVRLFLIPSDFVTLAQLEEFKQSLNQPEIEMAG